MLPLLSSPNFSTTSPTFSPPELLRTTAPFVRGSQAFLPDMLCTASYPGRDTFSSRRRRWRSGRALFLTSWYVRYTVADVLEGRDGEGVHELASIISSAPLSSGLDDSEQLCFLPPIREKCEDDRLAITAFPESSSALSSCPG